MFDRYYDDPDEQEEIAEGGDPIAMHWMSSYCRATCPESEEDIYWGKRFFDEPTVAAEISKLDSGRHAENGSDVDLIHAILEEGLRLGHRFKLSHDDECVSWREYALHAAWLADRALHGGDSTG